MSWVAAAAVSLGASEAALKLILGQLLGVPLMLLYRALIAHRETNVQHLFFFLSGILAGQWVIGGDVVHSLYAVLATYLILLCAGGTLVSVVVSFLFNFGYLLVGITALWHASTLWSPLCKYSGGVCLHRDGGIRHMLDHATLCPFTEVDWVDL